MKLFLSCVSSEFRSHRLKFAIWRPILNSGDDRA